MNAMKNTMMESFNRLLKIKGAGLCSLALAVLTLTAPARAWGGNDSFGFLMVPSNAQVAKVLPHAHGWVNIESVGPVEIMDVKVVGLPPNTEFDFFVIQVPNPPFGLSWYQGDIETDEHGVGYGKFVGRFSIETFIVAPGSAKAPKVHESPIADALMNPPTAPIHTFHLGLWFNSPKDAAKAGLPGVLTPFNGDHTAGVQVLNTHNFQDHDGPLRRINP